jgi:hypothetical protein
MHLYLPACAISAPNNSITFKKLETQQCISNQKELFQDLQISESHFERILHLGIGSYQIGEVDAGEARLVDQLPCSILREVLPWSPSFVVNISQTGLA